MPYPRGWLCTSEGVGSGRGLFDRLIDGNPPCAATPAAVEGWGEEGGSVTLDEWAAWTAATVLVIVIAVLGGVGLEAAFDLL